MKCSEKISNVTSDIRGPLYVEAMSMEAAGAKILKINSGNPAIFGHKAPDSVKKTILENLDKAVAYCDFRGMPSARAAIRDYYLARGVEITDTDVYVGNGVSELADISCAVLLNDGDELLVPTPCYPLWSNCAKKVGATPVYYTCDEQSDWYPDLDDMRRKVTPKTKAIVVINPNNPTGALYPDELLYGIAQIARENNLMVLTDEIYDRLIFDGLPHTPFAKIAPDLPVVTYNGLSKSHIICGFRSAWLTITGPRSASEEFRQGVEKLMSLRLCSGAIPQLIIPDALKDDESTQVMFRPGGALYERRKATMDAINACESLTCVKNSGALYVFPKIDKRFKVTDDRIFASTLLREKHILLVPGSGFSHVTPDHFRVVLLPSPEELSGAIKAIDEVLCEHFL